ncbi:MAG: hypothetical protein IIC73_00905 [Armatimonadetes bacterium]|nr:hypothetical protein [Armatimonadota bacterium]
MATRKYKPTSPGRRHMIVSAYDDITKGKKPERKLLVAKPKTGGRNHTGRITAFHRGGGNKRRYRLIDFKRIPGITREWVLNHVRAGRAIVTAELEGAGFELVGGPIDIEGLTENYMLRFRKVELPQG